MIQPQPAMRLLQEFDLILFPPLEKNQHSWGSINAPGEKVLQKPTSFQDRVHAQICYCLQWMEINSLASISYELLRYNFSCCVNLGLE